MSAPLPGLSSNDTAFRIVRDDFAVHPGIEAWADAVRNVPAANRGDWWVRYTCKGLLKRQNQNFETQARAATYFLEQVVLGHEDGKSGGNSIRVFFVFVFCVLKLTLVLILKFIGQID